MTRAVQEQRSPTLPPNEVDRVAALRRLDVLYRPRRDDLDRLARLAAYICGTPKAAVSLIDEHRQWSAAAHGYEPRGGLRSEAMCATSILSRDVSYTPDASADPRWADNPSVTGRLGRVRLYAAAPLILSGGQIIGTICAFSDEVQTLERVQLERLRDLAAQTVLMLELQDAAAQLKHVATRDPLTGLPNRLLLEESLALALARYQRGEADPALLYVDLDGFKSVNDRRGHAAGDELLRQVANRLLLAVRASDVVARLSGDELVVLCDEQGWVGGADVLAERLRRVCAEPYELSGGTLAITASIGVARMGGRATGQAHSQAHNQAHNQTHNQTLAVEPASAADLIARADAAMYEEKRANRLARRARASGILVSGRMERPDPGPTTN